MTHWPLFALVTAGLLLPAGCRPRYVEPPPQSGPESPRAAKHSAASGVPGVSSAKAPDLDAHPPAEAPLGDATLPAVSSRTLPNGLGLRVMPRRTLPLVSVRLVVRAGRARDGAKPGVAQLTAQLLAASGAGRWTRRKLAARIESLGGRLGVGTDRDATWLGLDVTRDHLDSALDLIAALATQPRFLPATFQRVKQRAQDAVRARRAAHPGDSMQQALVRRLFELPVGVSPYAHGRASADELGALSLADCRRWYHAEFVPGNAVLVVAGDVGSDDVARSAGAAFARWKGHPVSAPTPTAALPPDRVEVDVIDRPASRHSDIVVGTLGPDRDSSRWAALLGAVELLGGESGRLSHGLSGRRHLATQVSARVEPMAHGPALVVLSARSTTPHTAQAVQGILDAMGKLAGALPEDAETETALRAIVERGARRAETVQGLARMGTRLAGLGLPDDAYAELDRALRDLDPRSVNAAAQLFLRKRHVRVVVSGDAKRIAHALAHFGPVHLVNPAHDYTVIRSLPADPAAPLVIPAGKTK